MPRYCFSAQGDSSQAELGHQRLFAVAFVGVCGVMQEHQLDAMRVRPHGNAGMWKFRLWIIHNEWCARSISGLPVIRQESLANDPSVFHQLIPRPLAPQLV